MYIRYTVPLARCVLVYHLAWVACCLSLLMVAKTLSAG